MDAFLFTLALFAFWGLIGFATISVFPPRLRLIQSVLISPAIGVAITILPVFFINRAGLPVKDFGRILLPSLAALAVLALFLKKPFFPYKRLLPFLGIVLVALLLAARPMFSYGFDWVSFANDDMANYCLAAQRFLNNGFFDPPNLAALYSGKDYSLVYWFMHVSAGVRSGSELMLAVVWAFSGLNAHQIFMPVIMALHLTLVSGTGALVSGARTSRKNPMIAMALMAISPLTTLGALYQLIAQVGGLALLCAAVTLMYRSRALRPISWQVIGSIPAAAVFAALFVWYPEVLPFFGLGWMLYVALLLRRNKQQVILVVLPALFVGAFVLIALNKYVLSALMFMLGQASGGMKSADIHAALFPYFLVPSGLPALWGLIPITSDIHEPFVSLAIAAGLILIYWLFRRVIPTQVSKITAPISMLLLMMSMGLLLFYRNNDFGLFKLSMYLQPFLLGAVAIELSSFCWRATNHVKKIALLFALVPIGISQFGYVKISMGESLGRMAVIAHASSLKINSQFRNFVNLEKAKNPEATLISETSNVVEAKFQAFYTQNLATLFPAKNYFNNIFSFASSKEARNMAARSEQYSTERIGNNKFEVLKKDLTKGGDSIYVYSQAKTGIFNSYLTSVKIRGNYFVADSAPKNRLQFISSKLGNSYYFGDVNHIAFYQLENDPMFPGQQFAALGRDLLFEAINPTKQPRIVMDLTDTVVKQFASELPKPKVQGVPLDFVGRGSGRVFSQPIEPTLIDGTPYISVDMERDGLNFPHTVNGLMLLYGRQVPADRRLITAFGRDISLVSEEKYRGLQPPVSLQNFPADLANKNLEYSGIYEDGWVSEQSFFVLSASPTSRFFVVKGMVPQIRDPDFSTMLRVSINGREVAQKNIGLGNFELKVPVVPSKGRQRVDIAFSKYQQLPGADGRITGGKIDFIGFTEN